MKQILIEMIKNIFSSEKFPTRTLIIFALLVLLLSQLSMPINEKVTAIVMQNMQLDSVHKEMAQNMLSKMGTITVVLSVITSIVEVIICSLFVYLASKIIHADISFNKSFLLCLTTSIILLINDYVSMGGNLMQGVENIHSIRDVYCTSIGYLLHLSDSTFVSKILLVLNPFTFIAFAYFVYCLNLLFKVKTTIAVYTSLILFSIYVISHASLLNI